jgi:hypothetical protein
MNALRVASYEVSQLYFNRKPASTPRKQFQLEKIDHFFLKLLRMFWLKRIHYPSRLLLLSIR